MAKMTIKKMLKSDKKLVMITAYDALFAKLFDGHVDMILVGDSLNMSFMGKSDTVSATMDQMIYHTQAVCNGAKEAFIITDMPFGSDNTPGTALQNALRVYKESAADAVKIEGNKKQVIQTLTQNGIAVVSHIGLLPQSARGEGGYSVKGKDADSKAQIIQDALDVEKAGAVMLVIEGVKADVAKEVTKAVNIPVIGIGAGLDVDGQVLVWSDMLGFFEEFKPKFVKRYFEGALHVKEATKQYAKEVQEGSFPQSEHTY
ncbi:MAG: 3-methyl-2-oxobutanoate hydroxymethyltransferase [Campylobacterota bacterium]